MKIKNFIWYTGLWLYFLLGLLIHLAYVSIPLPIKEYWLWIVMLVIPVKITITNASRGKRGYNNFSFEDALGLTQSDEKYSKSRMRAMYPSVDKKYLSRTPRNLALGKYNSQYVSCPFTSDGVNIFTIGNIGSGKSVMLLNFLYLNEHLKLKNIPGTLNWFLIDIKGELFQKLLGTSETGYYTGCSNNIYVIQPSNRNSYGWDVFYRIHRADQNITDTERLKMVTDIADALICKSGDNPYFSENAQKILTGILLYYIYKGWDFIPIIHRICRSKLDELITSIVDDSETQGYNIVLDKLKGFVGKGDNESIQDVEATMKTYLDVFSYPDIVYCLQDNPSRVSLDLLNDGISCIDLAIEESMLLTYQPLFRLCTMQVLRHAESDFKESDVRKTAIIVDEAARVGEISGIDNSMATLRSRHTSLWLLYQSMSQFRDIYPKERTNTLLNLCELKIFLSGAGDKDTTDYLSQMAGDYSAETISYSKGGFLGGATDTKYSKHNVPIISGQNLMQLREKNEMIVFIFGHYYRFKKLMYFNDPRYKKIVKEIHEHTKSMQRRDEQ